MLHYSAIIYWNTSERNNEPILKVHFYILDGEKLCCGLYSFDSSNWIGFQFKEKKSKKKKAYFKKFIFFAERFSREQSRKNNLWGVTKIKILFWVYKGAVFQNKCSRTLESMCEVELL